MKYKLTVLALAMAIPSVIWASANFMNTDPVYIISNTDRETNAAPLIRNYSLVWNPELGKFDLVPGEKRRPITIEESMHPLPLEPQPNEPIYYGDDFSI